MRRLILAATLLLAPAVLRAQQPADSTDVLATVQAYHAALAAGDSAAAIRLLHPEVVIFESGHAETLAEYRGGHLPADIRFAAATRRTVTSESVAVSRDFALYTGGSHTTGQVRDRNIDARGVETMVLVRTSDGWRIRHIHWSSH
jgi:ketosteroid isomerase-like protein